MLQEGERGYLEGLASRYADLFRTHYGDVLEPLEELRRRETNASARMPNTQLTTSHSQPIYVPGKYSVSKSLIFAFICPFPGVLFFYCFRGRHNAVIGWHIVACLSPRFLLITLLPWHFAKLLSKGQNSREEHVQLIRYEHLSLFLMDGDNFITKKIVRRRQSCIYQAIDEIYKRIHIRLKLYFNNLRNEICT